MVQNQRLSNRDKCTVPDCGMFSISYKSELVVLNGDESRCQVVLMLLKLDYRWGLCRITIGLCGMGWRFFAIVKR